MSYSEEVNARDVLKKLLDEFVNKPVVEDVVKWSNEKLFSINKGIIDEIKTNRNAINKQTAILNKLDIDNTLNDIFESLDGKINELNYLNSSQFDKLKLIEKINSSIIDLITTNAERNEDHINKNIKNSHLLIQAISTKTERSLRLIFSAVGEVKNKYEISSKNFEQYVENAKSRDKWLVISMVFGVVNFLIILGLSYLILVTK